MKDIILKVITIIFLAVWMISVSCLDSESTVPVIAFLISTAWLGLIGIANSKDM